MVKSYWAQIEAGSNLRMVGAYHAQIEQPETETDTDYLWVVSMLLLDIGHPQEVLRPCASLIEHFRHSGELKSLQATLGIQALILKNRGDTDRALVLYKAAEHICRESGDLDGLANIIGNQAVILAERGDLEGAMALHKKTEQICRKLGDRQGVLGALGNQAGILRTEGDIDGAMMLLEEAE